MEKRTLLAFVLSFAVLIGWMVFFSPKQNQPSNNETPPEEKSGILNQQDTAIPHIAPSEAQKKPDPASSPMVEEKIIKVDTPLYTAFISNAGPVLKSFRLKQYRKTKEPDSPLIELVCLEEDMGDFLFIGFDNIATPEIDKITYQTDLDSITLRPDSPYRDLVFRASDPNGLSIIQTFRFCPDTYSIDLDIEIINQSQEPLKGNFRADLKALPPQKKGYYSYVGLAMFLDGKLKEVKIKKTSDEKNFRGMIDWVAYEDDYFISGVIPETRSKGIFEGRLCASGLLEGTYIPQTLTLTPFERSSTRFTLYFGPRDLGILKELGKTLDKAVDFGWTDIIARPLLYTLRFFNQYIHNYGLSIILLTMLIKMIFWPLTHKSYKSMKEMQKLQPRMAKIREKHKNNKEQINREMMALYKTYKVNPMSGCLPMIIQIPVFFALFRILGSAIELRQAPFMLWITDLSAPDRLFSFPFSIPFMEPPYGIPVLTLLMGGSMFIQQKMTPTPGDPTQAKLMMFLPVIFTFMFINFPSGLVLYWLVNNILSIGQQYRINKKPA